MIVEENFSSPAQESPELTMHVEKSFESLDPLRQEWDQAAARWRGPVYMTFDWVRVWWKYYGAGKSLRLFIFRAGGEIVGIVPVYFEALGIWPLRMRVARFAGSNIPPKVFDPPISPVWAGAVFDRLVRALLVEDRCDLLSFGPLSEQQSAWAGFTAASSQWSALGHTSRHPGLVHTMFYLPATMEEFFAPFGKSRTKYRGRYELRPIKKVHADASTTVLSKPEELEAEFERFAVQHAQQWLAEGKPGHFGDWPNGYAYNRELVKTQGALGRMRFTQVNAGGKVIASQLIFSFGDCYYWELPSREIGKQYDDFRLGSTAALTMVGTAIQEGINRVEGGLGHYPYKLEMGGKEHATHVYQVVRGGVLSSLRKRGCDGIRLLLNYGYKKFWFRRIQPRLPERFRHAQWLLWLRFDY